MELGHVGAEHLPKLAEDLLMPRVVLQVHLRLHLQASEHQTPISNASARRCVPSASPWSEALPHSHLAPKSPGQDSRAHLAVVDDDRAKLLLGLRVVKGPAGLPDLNQESLPLVEIFPESVIDVLSLHVPQTLVLKPNLQTGAQLETTVWFFTW